MPPDAARAARAIRSRTIAGIDRLVEKPAAGQAGIDGFENIHETRFQLKDGIILFTFYDIFDIDVAFIQACTEIIPRCTPPAVAHYIGLPVLFNRVGYVIGTLISSPLAGRAGRRGLLLVTMVITGAALRSRAARPDMLTKPTA